jgi:uncharacterized membrane protein
MDFALVILGVVLLVWVGNLAGRIEMLSKEVERLKKGGSLPSSQPTFIPSSMTSRVEGTPQVHQPVSAQYHPQDSTARTGEDPVIAWIKKDFFVKVGALLLLIAFGWFVSYAFANNWIGPMGRITLGLVAGALIMSLGMWRIRNFFHQGCIFLVLGSSTVLLTVYAARELYDFFTPLTALGVMFLSVVLVAVVSVKYKSENLAVCGLLLAAVAPFLTSAPTANVPGLFTYLLIVILGTLWVTYLTASRALPFAGLLVAVVYGMPFLTGVLGETEKDIALLFAFIFSAIFFVANTVSIVRDRAREVHGAHLLTAGTTGIYLVSWIYAAATPTYQSLLFAAWTIVFAVGAFLVYKATANRAPFYIYAAVSIGLLGFATATELDGAVLTIAFAIEAAAIVVLALKLIGKEEVVAALSWVFLIPGILSLEHIASATWQTGVAHPDAAALFILTLALAYVGASLRLVGTKTYINFAAAYGIVSCVYAMIIMWLGFHALFPQDMATTLALFTYTVIGFSLFIYGRLRAEKFYLTFGAVVLGCVVLRLVFVDVWQMELVGRIITFFAIGTLLISTAFIRSKETIHEDVN